MEPPPTLGQVAHQEDGDEEGETDEEESHGDLPWRQEPGAGGLRRNRSRGPCGPGIRAGPPPQVQEYEPPWYGNGGGREAKVDASLDEAPPQR